MPRARKFLGVSHRTHLDIRYDPSQRHWVVDLEQMVLNFLSKEFLLAAFTCYEHQVG